MLNIKTPYDFKSEEFHASLADHFEDHCIQAFRYQYENLPLYRRFCELVRKDKSNVKTIIDIPFLPIEFFKREKVICGGSTANLVFESSGTGGAASRHFVVDPEIYHNSVHRGFKLFYGDPKDYRIFALLPSYLERESASLVYMVKLLMDRAHSGGFYLSNFKELSARIMEETPSAMRTLLIGVTFALLDFADYCTRDNSELIIMETGGMKGKRKEIIRGEVHKKLANVFKVDQVHSEYGMTELLSQAYSSGGGYFQTPPWMKISIRDLSDPMAVVRENRSGAINVIDLANIHSCCFIATQDIGRILIDGRFEVLGRLDNSDLRGCNLMLAN